MKGWRRLVFAWRFARRELVAGELTVLALALVVAVVAMASVAFFSDRVERSLTLQASQLLAADVVYSADAPADAVLRQQAARRQLASVDSATFPSMVFAGGQAQLATFKAVSNGYPLRGAVTIRRADGVLVNGVLHPAPGEAWADSRLIGRLKLKLGDTLQVGQRSLTLSGEIVREPDATLDLYNFVPRLMFNLADLPATGLVQEGSRIRWRLMLAGAPDRVEAMRAWLTPRLPRGARLENVEEARPEVKSALERARRFLGMTAMLTVALAAAAVALAVRRYLARHWQSVAVLRSLGLTSGEVWRLFAGLFLLVGLAAGVLGTVAGYAVQQLLLRLAGSLLGEGLPQPGWFAWAMGPTAALVLLAGLALPPLAAIRQVSALAVLRAELPATRQGFIAPLLAVAALLGLTAWQIGDARLAAVWLGGLAAFLAAVALVAALVVWLARRLPAGGRVGWRHGVASLARRPWLAVIQIVALSVGLMALLTLTVVRADLIGAWQRSIPPDAPNRFVINIQPPQRDGVADQLAQSGLTAPVLSPMVRARLTEINGTAVQPSRYESEQAKRLAEREFNLSWSDALPAGNRLSGGAWWPAKRAKPQFSVEKGLAKTLGIKLGDVLTFDIGGTPYEARVTSLREVAWDSFRVNFFVIAPASWLGDQPASYITSFHLPPESEDAVNALVQRFPNLTVIDVTAIIDEVRAVVDRLARAVEAMFALALAAGLLVLWAALAATRDERLFDAGLMRALGASRQQVRGVVLSELAWLGALAGLLAGLGAMALGSVAATQLFNLPLTVNPWLPLLGMVAGMLVVTLSGWPLVRTVVKTPPSVVLRAG